MSKILRKISACFVLLNDLKGLYKSVDKAAEKLYIEAGEVFAYFNSDVRTDKAIKALKIDAVYAGSKEFGGDFISEQIEDKKGLMFFQNVAGALYLLLKDNKDLIAQTANEAFFSLSAKAKAEAKANYRALEERLPKDALGAKKRQALQKVLINYLDKTEQEEKRRLRMSNSETAKLIKLLKPHYLPGGKLAAFQGLLEKHL